MLKSHSLFNVLLLAAATLTVACSSDGTLEDENRVDLRQPMVFGSSFSSSETVVSRAATDLQDTYTNFKVGVWKNFGSSGQQNVMNGYEVDYSTTTIVDDIYSYNWYYENINGQPLRYWDFSAFPYEFRAVSPYLAGASITADGITVNLATDNKAFHAQSLVNDAYNVTDAAAQPCLVSHVTRVKDGTDFVDTDVIKNTEINTTGKANATREVHMPFHHLNCKIGFRIYIDNPMPLWDDYSISIQSIKITVLNADNKFITESKTYTATNEQGLLTGTFSDNTTATGEYTLLEHGLYKDDTESHWNFHYHLNKETAFDLTPGYLQQIPQTGVKLHVKLHMHTHRVEADDEEFDFERIISLDPTNLAGDEFTWEPDYRYIYYLHVPNLHGHEIVLHTCEILPWDEVQTTDIDVGL